MGWLSRLLAVLFWVLSVSAFIVVVIGVVSWSMTLATWLALGWLAAVAVFFVWLIEAMHKGQMR